MTSFDDLQPTSQVQLPAGNARQGIVRLDDEGETIVAVGPFPAVDAALALRLGADTDLVAVDLTAGGRTLSLDARDDDTVVSGLQGNERFLGIERETDTRLEIINLSDPDAFGFDYVIFGEWAALRAPRPEVLFGWGAFGARTAVAGMPDVGAATYRGAATGSTFPADGAIGGLLDVLADVTLTADFATKLLDFTTTGTRDLETGDLLSGLDMAGTLAIDGAGFSGTATTTSGLTVPVAGSFYGPAAQEAGAVFDMVGPVGSERYAGAFGAKR